MEKDPALIRRIIQKKAEKALFKKATAKNCAKRCMAKLESLGGKEREEVEEKLKKFRETAAKSSAI